MLWPCPYGYTKLNTARLKNLHVRVGEGEKKESFLFDPGEGETRVRLTSTVSIDFD